MDKNKNVEKLIDESGINTHVKVINLLTNVGWNVLVSPYYYDNIGKVVREIDIIAEKPFNSSTFRNQSSYQVNVQLFIECKFIKKEVVFWFNDKDINSAYKRTEKDLEITILGSPNHKYSADITRDKLHYLDNNKVAKIFSTNTEKNDVIYKAITQCLNSKIYYDQWENKPIFDNNKFFENKDASNQIVKYPLIICENYENLFEVSFNEGKNSFNKIENDIQIEINYTYLNKDGLEVHAETFLIDLINIENLSNFLEKIEKEVSSIINAKT